VIAACYLIEFFVQSVVSLFFLDQFTVWCYSGRLALEEDWMPVRRLVLLALVLSPQLALCDVFDFESLFDSEAVTTQFPGVVFSNTTALTAGINLNEFEFPPRSGSNVVFDSGGPISITFASAVVDFEAYFTYGVPLLMEAFNSSSVLVDTASSLFSTNLGLTGEVGSTPNELLRVSATGITSVVITGNPGGGSFVMDDMQTTAGSVIVIPEPRYAVVLFLLVAPLFRRLRRRG
jgi:hypothetical protein